MAPSIPNALQYEAQKGVALVAVIWAISLLSLIVTAFSLNIRSQTYIARNTLDNAEARAIADAGINIAIGELLNPDPDTPLPVNGMPAERAFADASLTLTVQSENGKFNLNRMPPVRLRDVFLSLGVGLHEAERLADAIVDYRDRDSLKRLNGAEDADYLASGASFGAKDAPFEILSELRRVQGMSDELFTASKEAFSVFSRQRRVDIRNAAPLVRQVLEGKTAPVTISDAVMARPVIQPLAKLTPTDAEKLPARLNRHTEIYTIRATATMESNAVYIRQAVIRLNRQQRNPPFEILEWKQGILDEGHNDATFVK